MNLRFPSSVLAQMLLCATTVKAVQGGCPEGSVQMVLAAQQTTGDRSAAPEATWTLTNNCPGGETITSAIDFSYQLTQETLCLNPLQEYTFQPVEVTEVVQDEVAEVVQDEVAEVVPVEETDVIPEEETDLVAEQAVEYVGQDEVAEVVQEVEAFEFEEVADKGGRRGLEELIGDYSLYFDEEPIVVEEALSFGPGEVTTFGDNSCQGTTAIVPLAPSGGGGDPHFKTWSGHHFDFHGACDLILLQNAAFGNGLGLDLHIRTKGKYEYSYIETMALRIGDDVLEVGSWGEVFFNGVEGASFPTTMAGLYMVTYELENKLTRWFTVHFDSENKIVIKTHKDMVFVSVDFKTLDSFKGSSGMIGSTFGAMLARDGRTRMEKNPIAFGQEWQVRDNESKLFANMDVSPQYPEACVMPELTKEERRRLGEESFSAGTAELACVEAGREADMEACVFDVLATADLDMAAAGAF